MDIKEKVFNFIVELNNNTKQEGNGFTVIEIRDFIHSCKAVEVYDITKNISSCIQITELIGQVMMGICYVDNIDRLHPYIINEVIEQEIEK